MLQIKDLADLGYLLAVRLRSVFCACYPPWFSTYAMEMQKHKGKSSPWKSISRLCSLIVMNVPLAKASHMAELKDNGSETYSTPLVG